LQPACMHGAAAETSGKRSLSTGNHERHRLLVTCVLQPVADMPNQRFALRPRLAACVLVSPVSGPHCDLEASTTDATVGWLHRRWPAPFPLALPQHFPLHLNPSGRYCPAVPCRHVTSSQVPYLLTGRLTCITIGTNFQATLSRRCGSYFPIHPSGKWAPVSMNSMQLAPG
jgi:hypothetical protein